MGATNEMNPKIPIAAITDEFSPDLETALRAMQDHPEALSPCVVVSAQHRQMLDSVLDLFEIRPHHDLDLMRPDQDLYDLTAKGLLRPRVWSRRVIYRSGVECWGNEALQHLLLKTAIADWPIRQRQHHADDPLRSLRVIVGYSGEIGGKPPQHRRRGHGGARGFDHPSGFVDQVLRTVRIEALFLIGIAVFFGIVGAVYWFWSYEQGGTMMLAGTTLLGLLPGSYYLWWSQRMKPRPGRR